MKLLFIIFALSSFLFLSGCLDWIDDSGDDNSATDTTTETPIIIIPDDPPGEEEDPVVTDPTTDTEPQVLRTNPITLSILFDKFLYFYDGEYIKQDNVNPKNCGHRCFTNGSTKVFYDEFGNIESTELLFMEPDFIIDDWIVKNIEPTEALALGARYKDYTRYYFQGVEYGNWFLNEYKTDDLIKTNGEIIAISGNDFHSISDLGTINHAKDILIHEFDAINRTAIINDTDVFWFTNYFNAAKQWQYLNGVWYSWNGYEFTGHLQWYGNSLWSWNEGEKPIDVVAPTVINAGTDENNLYFIECNTGWVLSFNPEFDRITALFQLYQGNGERLSGIDKSLSLDPVLIDGVLYFNDNGLRKVDLLTGISVLVAVENGEVWEW